MRRVLPGVVALALLAGAADAQTYTAPHWSREAGANTLDLNGATFTNHGLAGAGRLSARARDFRGETLGSFSSMALRDWKKAPDGAYVGVIETLPDRGPNGVGGLQTLDYANRIHRQRVRFDPATGAVAIVPDGGFLLHDATGKTFTSKDPSEGVLKRGGIEYPSPSSGEGAGRISLDPEGLAYLPNGDFYVSDEYAAGIYLFDAKGRQKGAIQTVPALMPKRGGKTDFNADKAPATGRRNNQGMEGISVSPDGTRLFAVLQSAAMQDSGESAATRNITRVLVYDISKTRTPSRPIGHYALSLPTYRAAGDGKSADQTASQSEVVALNNHQFLMLPRDGNGRGKATPFAAVYKTVVVVDIDGATNLAGTEYETTTKPVARDGAPVEGIKPATMGELINILNPVRLAKFGQNLDVKPSNATSLPEKIEAMALAPVLDPAAPDDWFLLVGSDNDFESSNGHAAGRDFNAALTDVDGTGVGDNDSLILVYRLTLPGYRP